MADPRPDLSPDVLEAIRQNADLFAQIIVEVTGEPLPLGRPGVAFLDGFIGRQRERLTESQQGNLPSIAGCYLGEAIRAESGGRWVHDPEYGVAVELDPDIVTFPLVKARKHFANGAEDSVLSLFDGTLAIYRERYHLPPDGTP